jgi:hypothetical protein
MDVCHRITFNKIDKVDHILDSLNIKYKKSMLPKGDYTVYFDIYESDPNWPTINTLHGFDWYNAIFTNEEILGAEFVRLMPSFERGYPQPKNFDIFLQNTFEICCSRCGAGNRQKAPIRISKEPNLGKNHFMSTLWTYELFCTQEVLTKLKEHDIRGYEIWPVLINPQKEHSKIISQLLFTNVAKPALADEDKLLLKNCPKCGTPQYDYLRRGYMHLKRDSLVKNIDCQLTYEWFGGAIFREYLISHKFAKLILDNKLYGVSLKPIKLI